MCLARKDRVNWGETVGKLIDLRRCPPSVTIMNVNMTLHKIQQLNRSHEPVDKTQGCF